MADFKFDKNSESNKSTELKATEQADTQVGAVESTDNAPEKAEDNKKTAKKTKREEPKKAGNIMVTYLGRGVWVDSEREHWSRDVKPNVDILQQRTYTKAEYENRPDLRFMVGYGEMSAVEV